MKDDKTRWNIEKIGSYYQEQEEKQKYNTIIKNAITKTATILFAPCLFIGLLIIGLGKEEE